MTRFCVALLAPVLLSGCLTAMASSDNTVRARIGQTARLGLISVTPLQVIEDSRCARGTQCVWAGQLRVRARVEQPSGEHMRTLILGRPENISGGALMLQDAFPRPAADAPIQTRDYSFVLQYTMPRKD